MVGVGISVLAAAALPVLADFNDAQNGSWNSASTWTENATPSSTSDIVRIDQFTVGATSATFTGGEVHLDSTGRLNITSNYGTVAAPLNIKLNGGTFNPGVGNLFSGASHSIDVAGVSTILSSTTGDMTIIGDDTRPTTLTGSGTLVVQQGGTLTLGADNLAANASNFSGTLDIHDSIVSIGHANMIKNASIVLNGGTSKLNAAFGAVTSATRSNVKNLSGSGKFEFWASNYSRDLGISGSLSPGTATAPGTITRSTFRSGNDIVFNTGSALEMDIFGPTQAEADQLVWTDSVSVSNMDFANGELKVRLYTPTTDLATTSWVLVNGDELGAVNDAGNDGVSVPVQDRAFGSVTFIADPGWQNLSISYTGTSGSSNRQVVLTGSFTAVPEPASLGTLALAGLALVARRRAKV
jgi:hypothetical protein